MSDSSKMKQWLTSNASMLQFFLFLGIFNLPFLLAFSDDFATTLPRFTCDEIAFSANLTTLFESFTQFKLKSFAYNLVSFGYGPLFWLLSFVVALPGLIIDSQQGIVIAVRLLSLITSLGALAVVYNLAKKNLTPLWTTYLILLFSFLSPLLITYSNRFHPEAIYVFFTFFAMYLLDRDDGQFGKNFYAALFFFACAAATKLLALLTGPIFLWYFIINRERLTKKIIGLTILTSIGSALLLHACLIFSLVRNRFFSWVMGVSNIVKNGHEGLPHNSLFAHVVEIHDLYMNIAVLGFILLAYFCIRIYSKKPCSWIYDATAAVIVIHLLFLLFYCYTPFHYGIALLYFIPLLIFATYTQLNAASRRLGLAFLLIIVVGNIPQTFSSAHELLFPCGQHKTQVAYAKILYVQRFLERYQGTNLSVGTTTDIRVKPISGKTIRNIIIYPNRERELITQCDLLFFDHEDRTGWEWLLDGDLDTCTIGTGSEMPITFKKIEQSAFFSIYEKI